MKIYSHRKKNYLMAWAPIRLGGTIRFGGPVSTFVPPGKFSLWGPACQPTTRSHAQRFTKVKSWTSSRLLVLNIGLLPTLEKFKSALAQYASRSSSRGFISEDPHIVWCAFASVPTTVTRLTLFLKRMAAWLDDLKFLYHFLVANLNVC